MWAISAPTPAAIGAWVSDLDVILVLDRSQEPPERRSLEWDASVLPVPADVLVYTEAEWEQLRATQRFHRTLLNEAVWVYARAQSPSPPSRRDTAISGQRPAVSHQGPGGWRG